MDCPVNGLDPETVLIWLPNIEFALLEDCFELVVEESSLPPEFLPPIVLAVIIESKNASSP